jgi:uncharacterized protein Yka (UPF0111/DUF47 family)
MPGEKKQKKFNGSILDAIFPPRYDFELMITDQADRTLAGVQALVDWMEHSAGEDPVRLGRIEVEVDALRYDMEDKLKDAFSTPFDRQDIYRLSRQMDYILNFSYETAREMHVFEVAPDQAILDMATALQRGTEKVASGVKLMGSDPESVRNRIREARDAIHTLDTTYIFAMNDLFRSGNAIDALKRREIYHHLRDAGRALRDTIDILHQAVVGIDLVRK